MTFSALLIGGLIIEGLDLWAAPLDAGAPATGATGASLMDLLGGRLSFVLALILSYGFAAVPRNKSKRC